MCNIIKNSDFSSSVTDWNKAEETTSKMIMVKVLSGKDYMQIQLEPDEEADQRY